MGIVKKKKKRNFVNFAPIELKIGANESARKKKKKVFFFESFFLAFLPIFGVFAVSMQKWANVLCWRFGGLVTPSISVFRHGTPLAKLLSMLCACHW